MAKTSPAEFVREVNSERRKVTWPTRKEATVTSIMVFIMVALTSVFFVIVDQILSIGIQAILGIGG